MNTLKFGNGEWYGKKDTILAYNDLNSNYKPLPFNFSRASKATVMNKDGLIEEVGSGQPRIDYKDDSEGALKLEPSRTNYVTQSETFTGYWGLQGASLIADNNVINPNGNTFSNILNSTSTGTFKSINKSESSAWDSKTLTMSCFAKKKTNDFIYFYNIGSASGSPSIYFNIGSGTFGSVGSAWSNAKIENYGNDWYRCSATITFGTATNYLYIANSDGNNNLNSTVGSQTYIWGTQIEEGSYSTSLINTQGSAVTRVADSCTNGANEQVINSTEGTFFIKVNYINATESFRISISDNTFNNKIIIATLNNKYYYEVRAVDASVSAGILSNIPQTTNEVLLAGTWKENEFKFFVNGTKIGEDTLGNSPNGLNTVRFDNLSSNQPFYGNVKDVRVYNTALTDAELQALTT